MVAKPVVLLLGTELDWHVSHIKAGIERSGRAAVMVLDYTSCEAEFRSDANGHYSLFVDATEVPRHAAVYDRVLIFHGSEFAPDVPVEHQAFACSQWIEFYHLLSALYGDQVINTLASRFHLSKPYQQIIASKVGFAVPETVVSNGKDAVTALFQRGAQSAVVKALANPWLVEQAGNEIHGTVVMTSRVAQSDVDAADAREFRGCPQLFQREIVKDHELRIMWVGGQVFAFRINSQEVAHAEVDWRRGSQELRYDRIELDDALTSQIEHFMSRVGLYAGSIDLVVDRAGQTWFLECNNQGAWGWLDEQSGGAILGAWVDTLCSRAEAQARAA